MKLRLLAFASLLAALLCSCGSSQPSPLIAQADRLNGDFATLAEESPMFLDSIRVSYADATLGVKIALADPTYTTDEFTEPLVQFATALYMKSHTGANLDEIANTLTKEEGKLAITIQDRAGATVTYDIPAARIRQLIKLKPMELNYNAARAATLDIMEKRAASLCENANAESCDFAVANGFAQYTFTFPNANNYARLKQAQLTGRYVGILKPIYDNFGACRPFVEDLLKSFSIDGYRIVFENKKDKYVLKASIPWRTFDLNVNTPEK